MSLIFFSMPDNAFKYSVVETIYKNRTFQLSQTAVANFNL